MPPLIKTLLDLIPAITMIGAAIGLISTMREQIKTGKEQHNELKQGQTTLQEGQDRIETNVQALTVGAVKTETRLEAFNLAAATRHDILELSLREVKTETKKHSDEIATLQVWRAMTEEKMRHMVDRSGKS